MNGLCLRKITGGKWITVGVSPLCCHEEMWLRISWKQGGRDDSTKRKGFYPCSEEDVSVPLSDLCDHQTRLFGRVQGVQVFNPGKMLCGSMGRFSSPFSPLKYPDLDHSPLRLDLQTLTLRVCHPSVSFLTMGCSALQMRCPFFSE